jgi:hypothetical protein
VGPIHQSSSHLSLCAWDPSLFFFLSHARAVVVGGTSSNSDSSSDRRAWRGNVVARRLRQSTTAAVRANVHRHLHCSPHYLLPLHTPPPPPVAVAFPSLISIHPSVPPLCPHLAAHRLTTGRRCRLPISDIHLSPSSSAASACVC